MKLNTARIWLGGVAGGIAWCVWDFFIYTKTAPLYAAMQKQGLFLPQPRYHLFAVEWIALLFVISILLAHLYAWSRATAGAGPRTALKVGMIVRFFAGVPGNFAQSTWSPIPRLLPLGWLVDLWGAYVLAAL